MVRCRGNHYPGLQTAQLWCTELQKVLVGTLNTFFRPPGLLWSLRWRWSNKVKPYNYIVHTNDAITKTHVKWQEVIWLANGSSGSCRQVLWAGFRIAKCSYHLKLLIISIYLTVDQQNLVWAMTMDCSIELRIEYYLWLFLAIFHNFSGWGNAITFK